MRGLVYSKNLARRYSKLGGKYTTPDKDLFSLLPNIKDKVVLDLGCGDGKYSIRLLEQGARKVFGIDPSREMVTLAKRRKIKNAFFRLGGVEHIPFRDGQFDLIFCRFVLHYFKDTAKAFREIHRVLKKNGKFLAIFNVFESLASSHGKLIPMQLGTGRSKTNIDIYGWPAKTIEENARKERLRIIKCLSTKNPDVHINPKFSNHQSLKVLTIVFLAKK